MKILPVMVMGKLLNGQTFPASEYLIGALITFGVLVFKFGDVNSAVAKKHASVRDGTPITGRYRHADKGRAAGKGLDFNKIQTASSKTRTGQR